jgi:putative ABC transport system permease protein
VTAAFGLPDSFAASSVAYRLAALGQVDESVTGPLTQTQITASLAQIKQNKNVQAATALVYAPQGADATSTHDGLGVHGVDVYAVPPAFDQVYGPLTDDLGRPLQMADLGPRQAFINTTLAQSLAIQPGEALQLSFGGQTFTVTVRAILSHDLAITGYALTQTAPEIILPQAAVKQPPNAICVKNIGSGGMDDTGPGGSRSKAVDALLQQVFGVSIDPTQLMTFVDPGNAVLISPLKPDIVNAQVTKQFTNVVPSLNSIEHQFSLLPPLLTCFLVGAGMLLLALLIMLLTTERRVELGISRALGLQRQQQIHLFLFEGGVYALVAASLGLPAGVGATALEVLALSHLPDLATGVVQNTVPLPLLGPGQLFVWVSWQSLLSAWCLGVLSTILVVWVVALWTSRRNIVRAMRDLDAPSPAPQSVSAIWHALRVPPCDPPGQPLGESPARKWERRGEALRQLLWELWRRGPLCLLLGVLLLLFHHSWQEDWLLQPAIVLLIGGSGLLLRWLCSCSRHAGWAAFAGRAGASWMGLGWLIAGILSANTFLSLFQPQTPTASTPPSLLTIFLSIVILVSGAVLLVAINVDLVLGLCSLVVRHLPGFSPINRTGLAHLQTARARTGVTIALLSGVLFLVLLLVTTNLGAIEESQALANTGGFQLEADVLATQLVNSNTLGPTLQALQQQTLLGHDFKAVGALRLLYVPESETIQVRLNLPGQPSYPLLGNGRPYTAAPYVADDAFLSTTTMPLYARAQGYPSDRQVWDTLKTRPGYAVLTYNPQITALPTQNGFVPFTAWIPETAGAKAVTQPVTIIGMVPASVHWPTLYLSTQTALAVAHIPYSDFLTQYLFRLKPGVSEVQAASDLSRALQIAQTGVFIQSLDNTGSAGITLVLTLLLSGYLALGLLFGALALGVIAGRAVVERRQQIGMMRALGFSRALVRRSFLLESGCVIALSVGVGTLLALWMAFRVAQANYLDVPLPLFPIVCILLGCMVVTGASVLFPARQAARISPAEALRYE